MSHGINANIVHRWVREQTLALNAPRVQEGFLPVPMTLAQSVVRDEVDTVAVIEIELRRGASVAMIRWPLQGAETCATLLRDWLR